MLSPLHTVRLPGVIAMALGAAVLIQGCSSGTEPRAGSADLPPDARIEAVTPTSLTATVNSLLDPPPAVRAVDGRGRPLAGILVRFATNSGTVGSGSAVTDAAGVASPGSWQLGTVARTQSLQARAGSQLIEFEVAAKPDAFARLVLHGGDRQLGLSGSALRRPLEAQTTDRFGNLVDGVEVRFSAAAGDGTIDETPVISTNGMATSALWTPGPGMREQRVLATAGSQRVTFIAEVCESPSCHWLYFVRDGAIHVFDPITEETRALTGAIGAGRPVPSPDGLKIAFTTSAGVHVMARDGTDQRLVAPFYASPSWSPDGRYLAISGETNTDWEIYVLDLESGGGPRMIAGNATQPDWSPDGTTIAFVGFDPVNPQQSGIHLVNPDGSDRRTAVAGVGIASPAWSPDGKSIAYVSGAGFNARRLYLWNGFESALLPTPEGNVSAPRWSRLGTRLAFALEVILGWEEYGDWSWPILGSKAGFVTADGRMSGELVDNAYSPAWGR